MDQGAGTALPDVSGTGNNGTLAGQTWITGGRFGGALNFNGNIVTVPDAASLDLATMTLEAWVRPSALGDLAHDRAQGGARRPRLLALRP